LPSPWDDVIKGVMQTPQAVIAQFTALVKARYEMIDAATRDAGASKQLDEGTSG
jgi:hypothetical protein